MAILQEDLNKLEVEDPQAEIDKSQVPVLVDCYASWCGPCKMLSPIIHNIAEKYKGEIRVIKVDIDEHEDFASNYGIMSIPTMLFFSKGELVKTEVGFKPENKICDIIENTLLPTSENIENEINNSKGALIVDFYANWCPHCQKLAPVIEDLKKQYGDDLKVIRVNVDRYKALADKYNVDTYPTLKFFKDGKIVNSTVGFQTKDTLSNIIENDLFPKKN